MNRIKTSLTALASAAAVAVGLVALPLSAEAVGPQTDRLNVSYTNSAGTAGSAHIFAAGLDWTKTVGLMVYGDGSGEYGLNNPNDSYLLDADGTTGLVAVAKARNMVLVTPKAPGGGCPDGDGVCWYQTSGGYSPTVKAKWAADLTAFIKTEYPIAANRIVVGGYSSGAQLVTEYFMPAHGEALGVDLGVAISYGGSPLVTANFTAAYKAATPMVWDVGTSDPSYQGGQGVQNGYNWYTNNGFATTELNTHAGGHSRSDFDVVMAREVDQYIPAATVVSSPSPSPTPSTPPAANWQTTVTPTQSGGSFAIRIPTSYNGSTYVTLSSGNYLYTTLNGDRTLTFVSQACGASLTWQTRTGSTTGPIKASGTLNTLACARRSR